MTTVETEKRASAIGPGRRPIVGICSLVSCVLCWASIPVLLRDLISSIDAWTSNGFRYTLAAVLYWPVVWFGWRSGAVSREVLGRLLVPGLLCLAGQVFFALTPYYLPASTMGFLIQASVVWSIVGAALVFADERALLRTGRFLFGLVLALAGYIGLALMRGALAEPISLAGALIMFGCTLCFGLYAVSIRYYIAEMSPFLAFGLIGQFVAGATLVLMFGLGRPEQLGELVVRGWSLLIASALLGIAIPHVLFFVAVRELGVSIASGVNLLASFITAALAWFVLGETMTLAELACGSGMVIGAGILLSAQRLIQPAGGVAVEPAEPTRLAAELPAPVGEPEQS